MELYKYPVKATAFVYELLVCVKNIFTTPYSIFHLYLVGVALNNFIISMIDEFSKVESIKKHMDECGYNKYRKYFRSKLLSKDSYVPKTRWAPLVYVPGIATEPFPKKEKFPWAEDFEKNYSVILEEFLNLSKTEGIRPYHVAETVGKIINYSWSTFMFVDQYGIRREENIEKCPKTWELLKKVPRFVDNNLTMFSVLDPHTAINEHAGWCNLFIRVHLALVNKDPSRVAINVGNEIHGWQEGKLLFLDDSFFHQVWNSSDHYRAVLFFDVWHPIFTDDEVVQLTSIYNNLRDSDKFKQLSLLIQEIEKKSEKKIFK